MKKFLFKSLKKTASCVILGCLLGLVVLKAPQVERKLLRQYVGSKVVEIVGLGMTSGGTGFHLEMPSGKTYIVTNRHVCELASFNQLFVKAEGYKWVLRKVIRKSTITDLCIIQGVSGIKGLHLAKEMNPGDVVHAVGHPDLLPLTMTSGEIIASRQVQTRNDLGFIDTFNAIVTTVLILPGSSGSPLVDYLGQVKGVMFAASPSNNWGAAIPLDSLKWFIRKF